jgi:tRNA threonylcarbamoyl adenosine modification protein (Sua5/YciO/YrdC/YwlC family)
MADAGDKMTAEIQHVFVKTPHARQMRHAAKMLENGAVVVYPTDTVYGLAADVRSKKAVERLFKIKDIPRHKPLSLIFGDIGKISEFANLENPVFRIMKRVLPGPFTFILPVSNRFPKILSPKRDTIGIRVPDCAVCQALTESLGAPLLSTSLPTVDGVYLNDPDEIIDLYGAQADLILLGDTLNNEVSTVIDFSVDPPEVRRIGAGDIGLLGL